MRLENNLRIKYRHRKYIFERLLWIKFQWTFPLQTIFKITFVKEMVRAQRQLAVPPQLAVFPTCSIHLYHPLLPVFMVGWERKESFPILVAIITPSIFTNINTVWHGYLTAKPGQSMTVVTSWPRGVPERAESQYLKYPHTGDLPRALTHQFIFTKKSFFGFIGLRMQ